MNRRVVVGLSGGVDSAVAAAVLLESGFEVIGATLRLHGGSDSSYTHERDAALVAEQLGIEHVVVDRTRAFDKLIVQSFVDAYTSGATPSPCVACNRLMKVPGLLHVAEQMGASWIATGHYAQVSNKGAKGWRVVRGVDSRKDQSYFLCELPDSVLSRLQLPLGEWTKDQVRRRAEQMGWLRMSTKSESQDLCFVPDGDYVRVVESRATIPLLPGKFVDRSGRVLGNHKGVHTVTIGQRKGLGVSVGKRVFVCAIDAESRQVVLGDSDDLLVRELVVARPHVATGEELGRRLLVQVRYQHEGTWALPTIDTSGALRIQFEQPVRAAAAGQVAVVYDGDEVVAGGVITATRGETS